MRPTPVTTCNVWPSGCVCHAVRAPGSKVTRATRIRAGAGASIIGSCQTVPVKASAGPRRAKVAAALFISIGTARLLELSQPRETEPPRPLPFVMRSSSIRLAWTFQYRDSAHPSALRSAPLPYVFLPSACRNFLRSSLMSGRAIVFPHAIRNGLRKTQAHSIGMPYGDLSFMGNVLDEVNGVEQ